MNTVNVDRLREMLLAKRRSARDVSIKAGLGETALKDILRGKNRRPAFEVLSSIARELDEPISSFVSGAAEDPARPPGEPISRLIPVVGEVRAGAWLEIGHAMEPEEWIPLPDKAYAKAKAFALRVVGRSMDREYADGTIVVVVDAADAGVRDGDHVVVRRTRGGAVETTLKEVVVETDGRVMLWPRSTQPEYQTPWELKGRNGETVHADDGPEIIGVVVATYTRRDQKRGVMVL